MKTFFKKIYRNIFIVFVVSTNLAQSSQWVNFNHHITFDNKGIYRRLSVDDALKNYKNHAYASFLKDINTHYQHTLKEWGYNTTLENRHIRSKISTSLTHKKHFNRKTYKALMQICKQYPHTPICTEILYLIESYPTQQELDSFKKLKTITRASQNTHSSPLKNTLTKIDIEFYLKEHSLNTFLVNGNINTNTFQTYALILEIEKMHQMQTAINAHTKEISITHNLSEGIAVMPKIRSQLSIQTILIALGQYKISPADDAETAVQTIMASTYY